MCQGPEVLDMALKQRHKTSCKAQAPNPVAALAVPYLENTPRSPKAQRWATRTPRAPQSPGMEVGVRTPRPPNLGVLEEMLQGPLNPSGIPPSSNPHMAPPEFS